MKGKLIRCSVPNCSNSKFFKEENPDRPDLVFFSFPKDRKNQWAMAIGRPEYVIKNSCYSSRRVCSDHFQESDFKPSGANKYLLSDRKRLQSDAVPSLLLPSSKQGERGFEELVPFLSIESAELEDNSNEAVSPLSPLPPLQKMENVKTVKVENCLICSEMTCAKTTEESSLLSGVHHKFNGSSGMHLLNQQLWATFILLRILELPVWKFEDILKAAGENSLPGEWFLVCDVCSQSLVQLVEMEEKVRALQLQMTRLKDKLQGDFRRSLEIEGGVKTQKDELAVRETIRSFFVDKNTAQTVEVKEESSEDYEEDNDFQSDDNLESGALSVPPSEPEDDEISDAEDDIPIGSPEQFDEKDSESIITSATQTMNKIVSSLHPSWLPQKNLRVPKSNPSCAKKRKTLLAKLNKTQASIKANAAKHYDCSRCGLPLLTFGALSKHYRTEHKLRLDKRWKDAKASSSQNDFIAILPEKTRRKRKQVERPNKERNLPCSECNLRFYTKRGRYTHIWRYHPETVGLRRRGRPKGPEKVKPRKDPKKGEPRKGQKKDGRRNGARKDKAPLEICEICGFKETKELMRRHVFHHKIFDNSVDPAVSTTEFICNICRQLFSTRRLLTFHKVNTHAEELGLEVYKCSYCSRNFMRKNDWIYHEMRVHQKRGLYPCDKCDYEAMNKGRLESHMAIHTDTIAMCEYCSATYYSQENLRAHIQRYHPDKFIPADRQRFVGLDVEKLSTEGDKPTYNFVMRKKQKEQKPINCKYCEAVLPHKLGFNLHLKESHKDMYKYQCDMCDKVYLSTASLTLHKKINHQEKGKPVKCAWCLKSVAHRLYLYSHGKVCPKRPKNGENIPKIMAMEDNCEDGDVEEKNVCVEGESETIG